MSYVLLAAAAVPGGRTGSIRPASSPRPEAVASVVAAAAAASRLQMPTQTQPYRPRPTPRPPTQEQRNWRHLGRGVRGKSRQKLLGRQ
jgi:hypothetical protein